MRRGYIDLLEGLVPYSIYATMITCISMVQSGDNLGLIVERYSRNNMRLGIACICNSCAIVQVNPDSHYKKESPRTRMIQRLGPGELSYYDTDGVDCIKLIAVSSLVTSNDFASNWALVVSYRSSCSSSLAFTWASCTCLVANFAKFNSTLIFLIMILLVSWWGRPVMGQPKLLNIIRYLLTLLFERLANFCK